MKVIKILGVIIGILVVAFLVMSLTSSPEGSLESSIVIEAPPAAVYEECVDIKKMDTWSPWYNIEPTAFSYEGPEKGVGAKSVWSSENPELGNGSLTITEAEENRLIKTKMVFEGFNGDFGSWIKIEPHEQGSEVHWGYSYSDLDLVGRFFMSFMDINEEMLPKFETGLADLKKIVEAKPTRDSDMNISVIDAEPIDYLGIETTVAPATAENISAQMAETYGKLMTHLQNASIEMQGMPLSVYTSMGEEEISFICGLPVASGTEIDDDEIKTMRIEGGKAVKAVHMGDYVKLPNTYEAVRAYMASNDLETAGNPYEVYITDPGQVKDTSQWVTHVFYPVQ